MPYTGTTVAATYKAIYKLEGLDITLERARRYFDFVNENTFPLFLKLYRKYGAKHEARKLNQRLNSARQRQAWWGQVSKTDDGSINAQSAIALLKSQNFSCAICSTYLTKDKHKQIDHIKPVSKGGEHTLRNVQWLCRTCNIRKKDHYNED